MAVPPWERIRRRPVPVKAGWLRATTREPASLMAGRTLTAPGSAARNVVKGEHTQRAGHKPGSFHSEMCPTVGRISH